MPLTLQGLLSVAWQLPFVHAHCVTETTFRWVSPVQVLDLGGVDLDLGWTDGVLDTQLVGVAAEGAIVEGHGIIGALCRD
jgi:hypothetical protein